MTKKTTNVGVTDERLRKEWFSQTNDRQRACATMLLYLSNMCTDFQLNYEFKLNNEYECQLFRAFIHLLNLPYVVTEDHVELKK